MNKRDKIGLFLDALKGAEPGFREEETAAGITTEIFTQGNCGNLAVMLALAFDGKCVIVGSHVLCEIDGRLYDIHGDVTAQYEYLTKTYQTWEEIVAYCQMFNNYSFIHRGPAG